MFHDNALKTQDINLKKCILIIIKLKYWKNLKYEGPSDFVGKNMKTSLFLVPGLGNIKKNESPELKHRDLYHLAK